MRQDVQPAPARGQPWLWTARTRCAAPWETLETHGARTPRQGAPAEAGWSHSPWHRLSRVWKRWRTAAPGSAPRCTHARHCRSPRRAKRAPPSHLALGFIRLPAPPECPSVPCSKAGPGAVTAATLGRAVPGDGGWGWASSSPPGSCHQGFCAQVGRMTEDVHRAMRRPEGKHAGPPLRSMSVWTRFSASRRPCRCAAAAAPRGGPEPLRVSEEVLILHPSRGLRQTFLSFVCCCFNPMEGIRTING